MLTVENASWKTTKPVDKRHKIFMEDQLLHMFQVSQVSQVSASGVGRFAKVSSKARQSLTNHGWMMIGSVPATVNFKFCKKKSQN